MPSLHYRPIFSTLPSAAPISLVLSNGSFAVSPHMTNTAYSFETFSIIYYAITHYIIMFTFYAVPHQRSQFNILNARFKTVLISQVFTMRWHRPYERLVKRSGFNRLNKQTAVFDGFSARILRSGLYVL